METDIARIDESAPALAIDGLSHSFKSKRALSGVSFTVDRGEIHGFVGPNGAGKTTTLKIVSTLMPPQRGTVKVFGKNVTKATRLVRQLIGYMPDHFGMYRQMTVFEYLDFFGAAYGQPISKRTATINDVLELTDMNGRRDDLIGSLSRGMEQRVSLARVLVHDPKFLLLDEPASGLDPRARVELMEILRELASMGKTVLISSHILSELANLCDAVTIIDRGHVKYSGPMSRLLQQRGEHMSYRVELAEASTPTQQALAALAGVEEVFAGDEAPTLVVKVDPQRVDSNLILNTVLGAGGKIVEFSPVRRQLDEVFMDLTEPGVRA